MQYIPIHAGIYWHVLQYIPIRVLCIWHVLWYVLEYVLRLYLHVLQFNTYIIPNTNSIQTNTDRYVLNTYLLVLNTWWYVFNTYHQYIPQYMPAYWYVLRCNTCQIIHIAILMEEQSPDWVFPLASYSFSSLLVSLYCTVTVSQRRAESATNFYSISFLQSWIGIDCLMIVLFYLISATRLLASHRRAQSGLTLPFMSCSISSWKGGKYELDWH